MSSDPILLVDDNAGQRVSLETVLRHAGYNITSADCGTAAIKAAEKEPFVAALLDIQMPDITGIDVLRAIKARHPDIFVVMMTGFAETEYAINALNAGASAYLMKPVNIDHVRRLLEQALERRRLIAENAAMGEALREWNGKLEKMVEDRTAQLVEVHKTTMNLYLEMKKNFVSTLEVLSIAIDQRDSLTATHSYRVTEYALDIARLMGHQPAELEKLRYAGLLHDIGKIETHKAVLQKDGSLTTSEYQEIQRHAHDTFKLLSRFKFRNDLQDVPLIASSHHERFDGTGYPRGLKGAEIPLMARILAVADVTDAITSKRHYRSAMPINNALAIMEREAGGHFDPACVEALFRMKVSTFVKIHFVEDAENLKGEDLVLFEPLTLMDLKRISSTPAPSAEELDLLRRFHRYYLGPVPEHLAALISKAA